MTCPLQEPQKYLHSAFDGFMGGIPHRLSLSPFRWSEEFKDPTSHFRYVLVLQYDLSDEEQSWQQGINIRFLVGLTDEEVHSANEAITAILESRFREAWEEIKHITAKPKQSPQPIGV